MGGQGVKKKKGKSNKIRGKNENLEVPSVSEKVKRNSSLWDLESQASNNRNSGDKKGNLFQGNQITLDIKVEKGGKY